MYGKTPLISSLYEQRTYALLLRRSNGNPGGRILLFDGVVVFIKDVIPLFAIIMVTSKKKNAGNLSSSASANHPYTRINDVPV